MKALEESEHMYMSIIIINPIKDPICVDSAIVSWGMLPFTKGKQPQVIKVLNTCSKSLELAPNIGLCNISESRTATGSSRF